MRSALAVAAAVNTLDLWWAHETFVRSAARLAEAGPASLSDSELNGIVKACAMLQRAVDASEPLKQLAQAERTARRLPLEVPLT